MTVKTLKRYQVWGKNRELEIGNWKWGNGEMEA